jgi:hypothetical protein
MTVLDFDMAAIIHRHLREKGVRLGLGDGLKEITRDAGWAPERGPGQRPCRAR